MTVSPIGHKFNKCSVDTPTSVCIVRKPVTRLTYNIHCTLCAINIITCVLPVTLGFLIIAAGISLLDITWPWVN